MSAYERNPHVTPTRIGVYPKRRSSVSITLTGAPSTRGDRQEPCYADFLRAPQGRQAVA